MTKARRVAAIALCAALTAGFAGLAGHVSGNRDVARVTHAAQPRAEGTKQAASSVPTVGEEGARVSAAQSLLSARSQAVKTHDKRTWMATVDRPGSSFGERQSVEFDNLSKLPIGQFAYGTVQLALPLEAARREQLGSTAWVATVTGTYALVGYDRAPRTFEVTYTLVRRTGAWRIADDVDGADGVSALQLWDLPGLRVLRGRSVVVIGNAPEARMREYESIADSSVRSVTRVWGKSWNAHVVLLTPSTTKEFAELVSRSANDGLDQVAAITLGEIEPGRQAQGDRVVINPKAFSALDRNGRNVVITHELTHVATRSSTTWPVPIWLSEGLADYVGYSGVDLPRARIASELLTLVRQGKGPKALPTADDFDPAKARIAPFYSASWLAVSRLVDLYGQAKVVSFYRAISGQLTVDNATRLDPEDMATRAFPQIFGVTEASFVIGWRGYLRTLALSHG